MYTGDNKTALGSQRALAEALLELMGSCSYSDITVSLLCRRCGISRQTFYSLFGSMDNVLRYAILHMYEPPELLASPAGVPMGRYLARIFSDYTARNRDFLQILARNGLLHVLYECSMQGISQDPALLQAVPTERQPYLAAFIAGTFTSVIHTCLSQPVETDPQELEELFYDLFTGRYFAAIL